LCDKQIHQTVFGPWAVTWFKVFNLPATPRFGLLVLKIFYMVCMGSSVNHNKLLPGLLGLL